MGRRKEPHTLEELEAERDYLKEEMRKSQNREKIYWNRYQEAERRQRTRRLCREAGALEHYIPELKIMDEADAEDLIQIAATSTETIEFLKNRGFRTDEIDCSTVTEPD